MRLARARRPPCRERRQAAAEPGSARRKPTPARDPREPEPFQPAVPRHDHLLHPGAAVPLVADDGAARELGRRGRNGGGHRRHPRAATGPHQLADRRRCGDRRGIRSGGSTQGEDDCDAADGGALQRRRRRRSRARGTRGVPQPGPGPRDPPPRRSARDRARRADRLGLLRRLDRRVHQAPGAASRTADHVSRTADREPGVARRARRGRSGDRRRQREPVALRASARRLADLRRALRAPDRRRRHAGRDLAPERVHGARGSGHRLRDSARTC